VKSYKIEHATAPKGSTSIDVTVKVSPYSPMPDPSDVEKSRKTRVVDLWIESSNKSFSSRHNRSVKTSLVDIIEGMNELLRADAGGAEFADHHASGGIREHGGIGERRAPQRRRGPKH